MKSKLSEFAKEALIARHRWEQPVRVPLRAYVRFCKQMDSELQKLVARWATGPNAGPRFLRRRGIR